MAFEVHEKRHLLPFATVSFGRTKMNFNRYAVDLLQGATRLLLLFDAETGHYAFRSAATDDPDSYALRYHGSQAFVTTTTFPDPDHGVQGHRYRVAREGDLIVTGERVG